MDVFDVPITVSATLLSPRLGNDRRGDATHKGEHRNKLLQAAVIARDLHQSTVRPKVKRSGRHLGFASYVRDPAAWACEEVAAIDEDLSQQHELLQLRKDAEFTHVDVKG